MKSSIKLLIVLFLPLCALLGCFDNIPHYQNSDYLSSDPDLVEDHLIKPKPSWDEFRYYDRVITFLNNSWNTSAYLYPIPILGNGSLENPYFIKDCDIPFNPVKIYKEYILFEIDIGSNHIIFENCEFSTTCEYVYGIVIKNPKPDHQIIIKNCTFSNFIWRDPIYMINIQNGTLENCFLLNSYHITLSLCSNIKVAGNSFYHTISHGLYLYRNNNTHVTNNTFRTVGYSGVALVYPSYNNIIANNYFQYCVMSIALGGYKIRDLLWGKPASPWRYYAPVNTTIRNNIIEYTLSTGIGIPYSNSTTIIQNTILYSGFEGIALGECRESIIQSNYVKGSGTHGIFLQECNYTQIQLNEVDNNAQNGVYVNDSSYTSVLSNTITNSGLYGLRVQSSRKSIIKQNSFSNNNIGNVRGVVGAFYMNNTSTAIAAAWMGGFYIIFGFTTLGIIRKLKKEKKHLSWKRKVHSLRNPDLL